MASSGINLIYFFSSLDPTGPASSLSAKQWIMVWIATSSPWRLASLLPSQGSRTLWIHFLFHLTAPSVNIVITSRKPESEAGALSRPFLPPRKNQCHLCVLPKQTTVGYFALHESTPAGEVTSYTLCFWDKGLWILKDNWDLCLERRHFFSVTCPCYLSSHLLSLPLSICALLLFRWI